MVDSNESYNQKIGRGGKKKIMLIQQAEFKALEDKFKNRVKELELQNRELLNKATHVGTAMPQIPMIDDGPSTEASLGKSSSVRDMSYVG
jgi:hypothetical protein